MMNGDEGETLHSFQHQGQFRMVFILFNQSTIYSQLHNIIIQPIFRTQNSKTINQNFTNHKLASWMQDERGADGQVVAWPDVAR